MDKNQDVSEFLESEIKEDNSFDKEI